MSIIIDYAQHLMKIEALSREATDLCLEKKYSAAILVTDEILVQARFLQATLAIMEAKG